MYLSKWFKARGAKFILRRGMILLNRYGLNSRRIKANMQCLVQRLTDRGVSVTLFTPGSVMDRYPEFVKKLAEMGAEVAVHGYYHIDFYNLSLDVGEKHLLRAAWSFERNGVHPSGFRCPYTHGRDELLDGLPDGLFHYSSHRTIHWDHTNKSADSAGRAQKDTLYNTIDKFYEPRSSDEAVSTPWFRGIGNMVEIPLSIPDDLQLRDGFGLSLEAMHTTWKDMLEQTHLRGELCTLLFHSELAGLCADSILQLVEDACDLPGRVWITRLKDISAWWREKASFTVRATESGGEQEISFLASPRATILFKPGVGMDVGGTHWGMGYIRLSGDRFHLSCRVRPWIGLAAGARTETAAFLREQGYILDPMGQPEKCSIYLDKDMLAKLQNPVELVRYIEMQPGPLVRFWRWPDGSQSALCFTGDMDALSLVDYVTRPFLV
jgi:peptidoglycan/xylan/chitin deacetylase (PgdA/CDA1 family)